MLKNDKQNFFFQQDGYATKEQGEGQGEKAGGGGEEEEEGRGGDVAISFGELRVLNFMLIMFTT